MQTKVDFSLLILPFVIYGILGIKYPDLMFKTSGINNLKKKPTKSQLKRSLISAYLTLISGLVLLILIFAGVFKGI
ncbi:hypothetical protein ACFQZE_00925 [Paenibacillus sp. GCM10027627]|uniref:hypothetical protein n=1 Tax=unclassified Paenibacillus TaxID=185978 RepID=UPI003624C5CB